MNIVENVLDNVPPNTLCGFLLPDNKLEKTSRKQIKRILGNHRIRKIVKLPEDLFFGVGVTTSIFIFQSGVPQNGKEIFACYMKTDGLTTVKNKGRHDVRGLWAGIEERWVDIVLKQSGDETCQWVNPDEHLSYQKPKNAFEITEEDFRKVAMDYIMFQRRIDAKELSGHLMEAAMYQSGLDEKGENLMIATRKANGDAES